MTCEFYSVCKSQGIGQPGLCVCPKDCVEEVQDVMIVEKDTKVASINHVDGILDIFDPPPLWTDMVFWPTPLENHVEFWRTPPLQ